MARVKAQSGRRPINKRKRRERLTPVWAGVLFALALCGGYFLYSYLYEKPKVIEGALPPVEIVDRAGAVVRLEDFRGRVVLVNLWATWCPPCVAELPSLAVLQARLREEGFAVVAISLDRTDVETIASFWDKNGLDQMTFYWDRDRQVPGRWRYEGIPTSYLLDREGRVVEVYNGAYKWDEEEIFRSIRAVLRGG